MDILGYTCSLMSSIACLQYHSRKSFGGSVVVMTMVMLLFTKVGSVHCGRQHGFNSCPFFSYMALDDLANLSDPQVHTANLMGISW